MVKLTLYGINASPPVRAVQLTLKALDLPYDYVEVNLFEKQELSSEYREKNPQHSVPTLEADGNFICDSHAIMAYLVGQYGKTDDLYPKDLLKRALVDQRLYYEAGAVFFGTLRSTTRPIILDNETNVSKEKIDAIIDVYEVLEIFLKEHLYMAGDNLTIADFSFITSVTALDALVSIDSSKYVNLLAWIERMKQLPFYDEACGEGAELLATLIKLKNITFDS